MCHFNLTNNYIIFCWVSSHIGIRGTEKTNCTAKSTLELPRAKVGVPCIDFNHCISQYILSIWQNDRNGVVATKLRSDIGSPPTDGAGRMKLKLSCVRHLTHLYMLKKDHPP